MAQITMNDIVYRGAIGKLFDRMKSGKAITHAELMKFKSANKLRSAYALLHRMRRFGVSNKVFTIVASGETLTTRSYRMVKGVAKGTTENWPKAAPVRGKTVKIVKKATKKPAKKIVHVTDDETVME